MTKVKIGDLAQALEKVKKENNIGAERLDKCLNNTHASIWGR